MAKKDFKNNPAMNFISTPADPEEQEAVNISTPVKKNDIPAGYVLAPESKSKRLQLLIKPSTYTRLKELSKDKGTSVNSLINDILEAHINK